METLNSDASKHCNMEKAADTKFRVCSASKFHANLQICAGRCIHTLYYIATESCATKRCVCTMFQFLALVEL